jgi:quinoprotein glucose dehydrogenase
VILSRGSDNCRKIKPGIKMKSAALAVVLLLIIFQSINSKAQNATQNATAHNWPAYGGSPRDTHYSPLNKINRDNVKDLQVAWSYDTGEKGGLESSPIIVDGVLYGITPLQRIFALDAASGKELWKFDSGAPGGQPNRGLSYWASGDDKRVFAGITNFVYALDARTGKPILQFGENGRIDLRKDLGRDFATQSVVSTSPGIIFRDLIILGDREPEVLPAPPGDIRAYDVRTGKLRWTFHTIPHPGEFGYETWPKKAWTYTGGANNWTGMALDEKRGVVYVPTGSAAADFYGADRLGSDLFSDCMIALNAETGKRIWYFQEVKHDLWDRDFPSPPTLVTVTHNGRKVDAVAQTTKSGYVFLFDRSNGQPLFPLRYRKYPASTTPGEKAAAEQVLPTKPAPFARQRLTEDMLTERTPEAHEWAVKQFQTFRSEGQFVPFSVGKKTVVFPGFDGGAEWGGSAIDPGTAVLYVNANDLAWTGTLMENTSGNEVSGRTLYQSQCSVCHGENRAGSPPQFPSLVGVEKRRSKQEIAQMIQKGKGRMPAFAALTANQVSALIDYISSGENKELPSGPASSLATEALADQPKYRFGGYDKFLDPDGYPAVQPPWGTLSAINLNTGEYLWRIPIGEYPELSAKGMKNTGTENYGGPIVTAGGLVFISATNFDKKIRAFDKTTGKLLWEAELPFAGNATPATYEVNGRQYIVIAAGGGKALNLPSGGVYVAFALPEKTAASH